MTSKQIRKTKFECDDGQWECAKWLQEIAAQLAETREYNVEMVNRLEAKMRPKITLHPPRKFRRKRP